MLTISTEGLQKPPARDPGRRPFLGDLPIAKLVIDPDYQREIKKDGRRAIERIAAEFDWSKFSTVVVAPTPDGRYAIIDGQHRTTAAALCGYSSVPCQVLYIDRAQQAASFAAINGSVTKITTWNIYRAALAAGEGWATEAKQVCEDAGCVLMTNNKTAALKEPGEIFGIVSIRELIAKHGADTVRHALAAYRQSIYGDLALAWGNTYLVAWITAVAALPAALQIDVAELASFHEGYDVLEADDEVTTSIRTAKREGRSALAHWAALAAHIQSNLSEWLDKRSEAEAA